MEIIKVKILIQLLRSYSYRFYMQGCFCGPFRDPYKQLDDLPVAVVNLDKGAVFDGKSIEVGKIR